MNLDFVPDGHSLHIPQSAYRPIKKCPHCSSVFINDFSCETCGRSLDYELVGRAFSFKSTYLLKEKYFESLNYFERRFDFLENKNSKEYRSYKRNLEKRFKDLCLGFSTPGAIHEEDRKILYMEFKYLISEMINMYYKFDFFSNVLDQYLKNDIISNDILSYIQECLRDRKPYQTNFEKMLAYRLWGILRVEFLLKTLSLSGILLLVAIKFRYLLLS